VQERKTLRIHATTKKDIDEALREQISASQLDGNKEVHFRIDDDDAVSSKFIERLRHIFTRYDLAEGTVICFPRGFRSFIHNGVAKQSGHHNPYHAQGLAFVVGEKLQVLPFKMQHGNAGRRRPSYVDPSFYHLIISYMPPIPERVIMRQQKNKLKSCVAHLQHTQTGY